MNNYDVVIIGGGPGGLTAAIYASRANLSTLIIEKGAPGGKMVKTQKIENWTGDKLVLGPDLSLRMFNHSTEFGAKYKYGDVVKLESINSEKQIVILSSGETIQCKKVIIGTGMIENVPKSIKNLAKYENKGISYCAICDGPLYKGKNLGVIGGGNSAIEEAYYLTSIAKKVQVFVRKPEELIAEKKVVEDLQKKSNAEIIIGSEILELHGEKKVEFVIVSINKEIKKIEIDAIFPYIGQTPVSQLVKHLAITSEEGYIVTNDEMETQVKGIFAIGDVRQKKIRQIATAVSDGVIAAKIITNQL